VSEINEGDLVVFPLKKQAIIAIGRVEDDCYENKKIAENVNHIGKVRWLKSAPRTAFGQHLLFSP